MYVPPTKQHVKRTKELIAMAGFLFDETSFVNNNVLLHEDRMGSQLTRFLDKSPTFVTYFHINTNETTVDSGLLTVERILGDNSPVRFNKINSLPIYGIESIVLQLENDGVLDSSYDGGEAILLPGTVEPLPNDYFLIDYMDSRFLFMVTNVDYDTIKSNNFYKITFSLKSIDDEKLNDLNAQTKEEYHCISTNIGTEDRVFIESGDFEKMRGLEQAYANLTNHFKQLFYSNRYNKFTFTRDDIQIYDPYMTHFIFRHSLFQEKNTYNSLFTKAEKNHPSFYQEYESSIYSAMEKLDPSVNVNDKYILQPITDLQSIFQFYRDSTTRSVQLGSATHYANYLETIVVDEDQFNMGELVNKHLNGEITSIVNLPLDKLSRYYTWMTYSRESFTYVPLILFVLRYHYNKFMKQ